MKKIMFGISLLLAGVLCILISWISGMRVIDIVGVLFGVFGVAVSFVGFFSKDK